VIREDGQEGHKTLDVGGGGRSGQTAFKLRTALSDALGLPEDDGELLGQGANHPLEVGVVCAAHRTGFGRLMAVHRSAFHLSPGMERPDKISRRCLALEI
jgi:hypothetical protein